MMILSDNDTSAQPQPFLKDHAKGAAAREPCGSEILMKACQGLSNDILSFFG